MLPLKHILLLFFFIIPIVLYSQFEENIKVSLKENPSPFIKLDSKNSIISNWGARISSIKTGLEFNHTLCFGMGYEWLASDIYRSEIVYAGNQTEVTVKKKLEMNYISLFTEYNYYNYKKWQFYVPISVGIGESHYKYRFDEIEYNENNTLILLYETEMIAEYRIIKYVGVGLGVGYRLLLKGKSDMNENFTSPIYILKLKIYFSDIYKDIFSPNS